MKTDNVKRIFHDVASIANSECSRRGDAWSDEESAYWRGFRAALSLLGQRFDLSPAEAWGLVTDVNESDDHGE